MLKPITIGLVLALLVALPAPAQDLKKGLAAYQRGDYATAMREWRPLAEIGVAAAQNNLGAMYRNGHGFSIDYVEALKWYRRAADQGNANAQYSLGLMHFRGNGVPQDFVLAHMWFSLSTDGGNTYGVEARDIAATRMTRAQTARAEKLAREWRAMHKER